MSMVTIQQGWEASGSGFSVISGTLCLPRIGAWHCDLAVDSPAAITGKVTVRIADKLSLRGTVNRGGAINGIANIRIVAGADGLRKNAKPTHYTTPPLRLPLSEILTGAGESLSATAVAAETAVLLAWTTIAAPTGAMVQALMELAKAGTAWRFLPDGSFWCGPETWPESSNIEVRELAESPEEGTVAVGLDVPDVLPGTTVRGRKVDYVEHVIARDKLRSMLWLSDGDTLTDRVKVGMMALGGPPRALLDYRASYRAKVLAQSSNLLKLDLRPDEARLPDMSNIPIKPGVPGTMAVVNAGEFVMVSWENGKPDRPFASAWDSIVGLNVLMDGVLTGRARDPYTTLKQWQLGNASRKIFGRM